LTSSTRAFGSFTSGSRTGSVGRRRDSAERQGAWVSEQKVEVENGSIVAYRVTLRISFVLE